MMTGHQQAQQPQRIGSKSKQKQSRGKQEPAPSSELSIQPSINVDELAREKVEEVERSLKQLTSFKLNAFNGWFSVLKQIISAADLHRTSDGRERENETQPNKPETTGDSIYADYSDDNEQFNAHVDLSEQFATNSVKWTIRVQAFKIVHRLVRLLCNNQATSGQVPASAPGKPSPILERYLSDLVRLAFVAATSPYDELKMQGFEMFKFLIEKFATVEEKEFPGHSILEQYKTQVLSAVKPAFNLDAPPYITAIASQICSLWICQGLEKELSDIKRTYQLMLLSTEKLEGQGENQHSKLYTESELEQERVGILGSWAQLYIASKECEPQASPCGRRMFALSSKECANLNQLVKPQLESLSDKWWDALKDFALLIMPAPKFLGTSHDNEHVYTREVALKLFAPNWPKLVLGLSIYLTQDREGEQTVEQEAVKGAEQKTVESSPGSGSASDLSRDNNSASDSDASPRRRTSTNKYAKFLCGILMKELTSCLIACRDISPSSQSRCSNAQLTEATSLTLRSVNLLLSSPKTKSVFAGDLTIAQEFYTTLYGITVAHGRDESNKLLLSETLDKLYEIALERVLGDKSCVRHALAKLVGSLMTSMRNIEIACRQKSPVEMELHKRHLNIRLGNLLKLVRAAPREALEEAPLREALIAVFQEMLRFDPDPSVGLRLANQLEALYPVLDCEEHRAHMIGEIFGDLCKRAEEQLNSLVASPRPNTGNNIDKLKLSQAEALLASTRASLGNSVPSQRGDHIGEFLNCVLLPTKNVISLPVDATVIGTEHKHKRELVDYCLSQVALVQNTFPDRFEVDSSSCALSGPVKSLYESAMKWQQEVKSQLENNRKHQESKRTTNNINKTHPSRPAAAKITLKADFSNFYAKKA